MTLVHAFIVFVAMNGDITKQEVQVEPRVCGFNSHIAFVDPVKGILDGQVHIKCTKEN